MKNYTIILLIFFAFVCNKSYSQIKKADSLTRAKADSLILKIRDPHIKNNDYVLFSIAERWYLVIVKDIQGFHEYYLNPELKGKDIKGVKFLKKSCMLTKIFDEQLYLRDYVTFDSPYFKGKELYSQGNITYFYLMKNRIKYGEARLSVKISPNPIRNDIYNFLSTELLLFMAKNAPNL